MPKGTSGGKRTRSLGGGAIELYNISVRPSSISGQGAFTDHQIRKGNSLGVAFTQVNSTGIPDIDFTSTTLGQYINHSKDPNVKLVHVNNGQYEFQAIKHIRRGQELRADYDQIEKTIGFKGNRDFREITGKVYSAPYTLDEIRSQYGEGIYNRLKEDPIHRWRAETGVELIHKEPTNDELQRIWKNWNLMTNKQKKESDHKSKELFGKTNVEHYNDLSEVTLQNKSHVDLRKQFKNSGINIDYKSMSRIEKQRILKKIIDRV